METNLISTALFLMVLYLGMKLSELTEKETDEEWLDRQW